MGKRSWIGSCAVVALVLAACSGGSGTAASRTTTATESTGSTVQPAATDADVPTTPAPTTTTLHPLSEPDAALLAELGALVTGTDGACDLLDTQRCLLPFPSNFFTTVDATSDTGRRIAITPAAMPANASGVGIAPSEWNRNDGFSPNSSLLTYVPGLDAAESALPSFTDPEASLADDSPVVLVDADTGERVPLWAELDARAAADTDRLLVIHPLVVLPEGHRFVVGLRGLSDASGKAIEPGPVFLAYRDRIRLPDAPEARRDAMEATFAVLGGAAVDRDELYLAWDFTVASTRNLSERMLHIRDETLDLLGGLSPEFSVTEVIDAPDEEGLIARQVVGTYTVPNFLTGDGGPGSRFSYGEGVEPTADALPAQNDSVEAPFVCNIPAVALAPSDTGTRIALYGHGLLGSNREVSAGNVRRMAAEHNVIFCATKWAGMSEDDIPNAVATLGEVSNFPTMADRLQQGVLNQIVLGRALLAVNGLFTHPAFADVVDLRADELVFDGNSQGGIMGLALAAVSPDIERAVLGVPGMNYSLLLPRSVDFDDYEAVMKPAYPNDLDRMLIISIMQMLWDRGEGAGYVQHVTANTYDGGPGKQVLLDVALGDHQVTQLSAFIEARALGAAVHLPLARDGRLLTDEYAFGLEPLEYPGTGSAIVLWDSGAPEIPLEGVPPRDDVDPHEDPRADADVRRQKAAFLFDDTLIDVCAGPCTADRAP
ncbi:MAG: hypothetical protein AB7Q42_22770 [Acidimicrobiia bacterium]